MKNLEIKKFLILIIKIGLIIYISYLFGDPEEGFVITMAIFLTWMYIDMVKKRHKKREGYLKKLITTQNKEIHENFLDENLELLEEKNGPLLVNIEHYINHKKEVADVLTNQEKNDY